MIFGEMDMNVDPTLGCIAIILEFEAVMMLIGDTGRRWVICCRGQRGKP